MYHTPWTKKGSSFPSDRIQPHRPPQAAAQNAKGKGKQPQEPLKSWEVRRIEALIYGIKTSSEGDKDPKGGCFCLAREHPLSKYTPICNACGLILCSLNLPQYCCPHCSRHLITDPIRESIIVQLDAQLATTIFQEAEDRERAIDEARKAAGAFPTLSGYSTPSQSSSPGPDSRPSNQAHKVLSLNSKTKKVTVSSYTTTPIHSRAVSRNESPVEQEPVRIAPPIQEVGHAKKRPNAVVAWENLLDGGAKYIPLSAPSEEAEIKENLGKKRRRNKGKGKENEANAENMNLT